MGMFKKAKQTNVRLKMYVYGETGTGKTVTALHFPSPAVIDTEKGTTHYAKFFEFARIESSDPDEINKALDELVKDPQGFKTIVIDPFTVLYDKIQAKHEKYMKAKTGNMGYTLQPLDYKLIKKHVKDIIDKLLALDMNVIVTARSAVLYETDKEKGEFMKVIGNKAEGPKELPYLFDVVLELSKKDGKFWATVQKDRTNSLPPEFEYSYQEFTKYLGIEGLERDPVVFDQTKHINERSGRIHKIEHEGKPVYTAGISSESLTALRELVLKLGGEDVKAKLNADYGIDSFYDLAEDEAKLLIKELKKGDN